MASQTAVCSVCDGKLFFWGWDNWYGSNVWVCQGCGKRFDALGNDVDKKIKEVK